MNRLCQTIFLILILLVSSNSKSETKLVWGIAKDLYYHIKVAKEFKKIVEKETQERVKIEIKLFDPNVVIKSASEFILSGEYQITQDIIGNFATTLPEIKIWEVPFLFESFDHAEKYIVSKKARGVLARLSSQDIDYLDYSFSGGPMFIYSPKKIDSFEDLKGQTISINEDFGFNKDFLSRLGIIGVKEDGEKKQPAGEELAAFVDAIVSRKDFNTLWLNMTSHRFITRLICVSKKSISEMKPDDQKAFEKLMLKMMVKERKSSAYGAKIGLASVRNRGGNVNIWTKSQFLFEKEKFEKANPEYRQKFKNEIGFIEKLGSYQKRWHRKSASIGLSK